MCWIWDEAACSIRELSVAPAAAAAEVLRKFLRFMVRVLNGMTQGHEYTPEEWATGELSLNAGRTKGGPENEGPAGPAPQLSNLCLRLRFLLDFVGSLFRFAGGFIYR